MFPNTYFIVFDFSFPFDAVSACGFWEAGESFRVASLYLALKWSFKVIEKKNWLSYFTFNLFGLWPKEHLIWIFLKFLFLYLSM